MLAILFMMSPPPLASAHGEQSQQAFQRTATVVFYDVNFSTDKLDLGQELTITGTMRIMNSWPDHTIPPPEIGYLTVNQPGPVFSVQDREINGEFAPQSVKVSKGSAYPFKLVLKARMAGTWHIHPAMAMHGVGTLVGPGQYITINNAGVFTEPQTLADGRTVDLNDYGMARVVIWQLIGLAVAGVYAAYWLRKSLLQRAAVVNEGGGRTLVTKQERKVSIAIGLVALVVGFGGYIYAAVADGPHIPLQVDRITPTPEEPSALAKSLSSKVESAVFQEKSGNLLMTVKVTNNSPSPVSLDHLQFAEYITKVEGGTGAPTPDVATVTPSEPIPPGETRELKVSVDARELNRQNLLPFNEAEIKLTGLMFFRDAAGQTSTAEINEVTSGLLPDYSS
ncbi:methane monooxygenase/ammonia monooxygenase subunit B [Candidatus Mycolicibacterium alkanivorans]|uniref:Methane monooxygenase/ammonia monooxygenase subunit B n=1 Tax=Candidatus Mycolicibacterium alkanivorans TaxID=2954114 RepID=A0ABS9YRR0_9MYCO|nr:methane monooxygenase/ammonia monooxygenase subunit B [Candidatus Mycolicibacterium alkanivorans]MCI4673916.1 methane monooxygenase/ammonia monooxygenase subunit B [Candidatus Mycolicibacterium alkanivorans]